MPALTTTDDVLRAVRDMGFALAGVVDAAPSAHAAFFENWLAEGKHGQMRYLAEHVAKRLVSTHPVPGAL